MLSEKERNYLLNLARKSIGNYLETGKKISESEEIPLNLKKNFGVFVTLTLDGVLRGCIGYIEPIMPVYKAVAQNAINAAFSDSRFEPLTKKEFLKIKIEISILTLPIELKYSNSLDLLKKLTKKEGIIIKKGYKSATFLPQVWEELNSKEEFLSHLCMKANLDFDEWQNGKLQVLIYFAEHFSE